MGDDVQNRTAQSTGGDAPVSQTDFQAQLAIFAAIVPGMIYAFKLRPDGSSCMPFATAKVLELYGFQAEELRDDCTPIMARIHPDDLDGAEKSYFESARNMTPWRDSYRYLHPTRGEIWLEGYSMPRRDEDGSILWYGFVHDITVRKTAEQALRKSEQRLLEAQRIGRVGDWEWNLQTGEVKWSPETYAMFRRDPMKPTFTADDIKERAHADDLEKVSAAIGNAISKGVPVELEYRIRVDDESVRVIRVRGEVTEFDLDGRPLVMHGTNQDVTDQKQLEERMRESQKMEAIGRLAGGIAHDFRNQLMVISGCMEAMADASTPPTDSAAMVKEIKKAIDRSASLIADLMVFSRCESLKPAPVDLSEKVSHLARTLPRFVGEDVRVVISLSALPCVVTLDAIRLNQAILNLVNNARQAMPTGGTLTIATDVVSADKLDVNEDGDSPQGSYAVLSVGDTGTGMDELTMSKMFEPFFTTKPVGQGTGLGLAMVYGFVKQSNGFVSVKSKLGVGTEIRLAFPRVDKPVTETAKPDAEPSIGNGNKGTILLVEDEAPIRSIISFHLKQRGYTVFDAEHPAAAMELLEQEKFRPDLLITDLVMPGKSGLDLARQLRQLFPELPVLFISGYAQDELAARGMSDVPGPLLLKPFGLKELAESVRAAMAPVVQ